MKRTLLNLSIGIALLLLPGVTMAQRYLSEVFSSVTVTTNVQYGENISVFPPPTPTNIPLIMDVYEPAGDLVTERPLIIFMHTGSYLPRYINGTPTGSRNDSATVEICSRLARRGYVVANMDYRLGWNPAGSNVDIRRGTLLNAVYRSIQDAKACVRYFRKDAATTDVFKIDTSKVILGGQGTGGYIALNFASLEDPAEIALPKFISGTTDPTYGFVAGQPYVNQALLGDYDGYGGVPQLNNPNNSVGYANNIHFVFNLGGALGDSSWIEPGDAPTVAMHVIGDPFAPYSSGIVYVPGNPPQSVVDVIGSRNIIKLANQYGNNNCFINAGFNDVFTQAANVNNEGFDGLYGFATIPAVQAGPWDWYDSLTVVNGAAAVGQNGTTIYQNSLLTNPNMSKAKAIAYIDTVMGYLNPRIVYCLNLPTGISTIGDAAELITVTPNPVADVISIDLSAIKNELKSISIYDVAGRKVLDLAVTEARKYDIDRGNLNAGSYVVRVQLENGEANKKIILR
ncbi:MAG: T9SS type A sorting domain-containing protein [Bacteroidota bacterium]|nr:T9SS type A sorting domain-containing protein [Bacteroidota bacterium]